MNIIVKPYGSGLCYCRPDTTWERENKDFYSPECVKELHWSPIIFVRISKAGKCIGGKFASRYYDEFALGVDCLKLGFHFLRGSYFYQGIAHLHETGIRDFLLLFSAACGQSQTQAQSHAQQPFPDVFHTASLSFRPRRSLSFCLYYTEMREKVNSAAPKAQKPAPSRNSGKGRLW